MLKRSPRTRTTLDAVDRRLLLALSRDGRQAAAVLGKRLGLSRQAVAQRLRVLEQRGVIRGYHADVDPSVLGLDVRAQVRLTLDGRSPHLEKEVLRRLTRHPFVRAVYRVSGEDCFIAHLVCRDIPDVNAVIADLKATRAIQSSRTAFVLETILEKGGLGPVESDLLPPSTPR